MTTTINASPTNGLVQTADGSGVLKVQSNGVTTNALAWVNFNGVTTATIRASYNVSSITRNATGYYTVNFATALSDANYAPNVTFSPPYGVRYNGGASLFVNNSAVGEVAPTTSAFNVITTDASGSQIDPKYVAISVFGN